MFKISKIPNPSLITILFFTLLFTFFTTFSNTHAEPIPIDADTNIIDNNTSSIYDSPDQSSDPKTNPSNQNTPTIELFGRIFTYLLLLIAIGAIFLYFFKQGRFMKGLRSQGKTLKVTETHVLGNKQFLVVVEYQKNKILLGIGPGVINTLASLDNNAPNQPPKENSQELENLNSD